jgi:hypothetical protein
MSILRFIRPGTYFDDATAQVMSEAFDAACLEKDVQSEDGRELIAFRIIEAVRKGERNPERLKRAALVTFER